MNDIFKEILDKTKTYQELIVKGNKPEEALEKAFGKEVAEKTQQQLETIRLTNNN